MLEGFTDIYNEERVRKHLLQVVGQGVDKTLKGLELDPGRNVLFLRFSDGSEFHISDQGQSCCEHRYITTDDKLEEFVGAKFLDINLLRSRRLDSAEEYGDVHDVMFVAIRTSNGTLTLVTHNEHNGYYGGFEVDIKYYDKPGSSV